MKRGRDSTSKVALSNFRDGRKVSFKDSVQSCRQCCSLCVGVPNCVSTYFRKIVSLFLWRRGTFEFQ